MNSIALRFRWADSKNFIQIRFLCKSNQANLNKILECTWSILTQKSNNVSTHTHAHTLSLCFSLYTFQSLNVCIKWIIKHKYLLSIYIYISEFFSFCVVYFLFIFSVHMSIILVLNILWNIILHILLCARIGLCYYQLN